MVRLHRVQYGLGGDNTRFLLFSLPIFIIYRKKIMSSTNRRIRDSVTTNSEGTSVPTISYEKQLSRLVLASMLWEKQFYLDGTSNADLIKDLVPKVPANTVAVLAIEARHNQKLRHMPLLLLRELARNGKLKASVLCEVIQRADEMGEFLSLYWAEGKTPISNQVKKGLAQAFGKFNEYQLSKYNREGANVAIRDVMFLSHAKPTGAAQEALFKRVAANKLAVADTWETSLSAGADKKETFARLMSERKLGALAFLRNLRNMANAGVSETQITEYSREVNVDKVLPFRYLAAMKVVPQYKRMLEAMMLRSLSSSEKLNGRTVLLVDVSYSMFEANISSKGDITRFEAAAALAILCSSMCESLQIFTFSNQVVEVKALKGMQLVDAIDRSQPHVGTRMGAAISAVQRSTLYDRMIVITDEQSQDVVGSPRTDKGYMLNVASLQNGVNRKDWTTITGFSEACFDYIREVEKE